MTLHLHTRPRDVSRRRACLTLAAALPWSAVLALASRPAAASSPEAPGPALQSLERPRLRGQGTLRFLGLKVYDAFLWTQPGFEAANWTRHPFVLELRYARSLKGSDIAMRSLEAMQRMGPIDEPKARRWLEAMRRAFPDVERDERLAGAWSPTSRVTTFHARAGSVSVDDGEFGARFFGLWLDERSSEPSLRAALLGLRAPSSEPSS